MTELSRTHVAASATRVEMTQIVLPGHTNALDTAFGGQIAAWADICAAVAAQRFCRGPAVTASMDQLDFRRPVRKGMTVVLKAQVNRAWTTSMECGVRVETEDPFTGERQHCCTAYFTFVALGPDGTKRTVPALDCEGDPVALRRYEAAELRRNSRLELRVWKRAQSESP